jgi:hypothetical protein
MLTTRIASAARSYRELARRLLIGGFSLTVLATGAFSAVAFNPSPAFAQKGKKDEEEKPVKSYTLPYFFSGIAILLVVVPLCLPAMRPVETPKEEDD